MCTWSEAYGSHTCAENSLSSPSAPPQWWPLRTVEKVGSPRCEEALQGFITRSRGGSYPWSRGGSYHSSLDKTLERNPLLVSTRYSFPQLLGSWVMVLILVKIDFVVVGFRYQENLQKSGGYLPWPQKGWCRVIFFPGCHDLSRMVGPVSQSVGASSPGARPKNANGTLRLDRSEERHENGCGSILTNHFIWIITNQ